MAQGRRRIRAERDDHGLAHHCRGRGSPHGCRDMSVTIRTLRDADWPAVWAILEPIFRAGDSYSFAADITAAEAHRIWVENPTAAYVAETTTRRIVGSYYIQPNQPGQGAHVCNCGYAVAAAARGRGVASAMCRHSQQQALAFGFRGMQYNFVAATNAGAVRLWQQHGFDIVGTLPEAFRHPEQGYVDAYVMYKLLEPAS